MSDKKKTILLRITEAEHARLTSEAKEAGLSVQKWAIEVLFENNFKKGSYKVISSDIRV